MNNLCRLIFSGLILAMVAALSPGLSAPASAVYGDRYCSEFKDSWSIGQALFVKRIPGTARLDGDGDGIACEDEARATKVPGEPGCYRKGLLQKKICTGRDLYRMTYLFTSDLSSEGHDLVPGDDLTPEKARGVLLDVFGPYATYSTKVSGEKQYHFDGRLEGAYDEITSYEDADCARKSTLGFIKKINDEEILSSKSLDLLGWAKGSKPIKYLVKAYVMVASEVIDMLAKVSKQANTTFFLTEMRACGLDV